MCFRHKNLTQYVSPCFFFLGSLTSSVAYCMATLYTLVKVSSLTAGCCSCLAVCSNPTVVTWSQTNCYRFVAAELGVRRTAISLWQENLVSDELLSVCGRRTWCQTNCYLFVAAELGVRLNAIGLWQQNLVSDELLSVCGSRTWCQTNCYRFVAAELGVRRTAIGLW